MDNYRTRQKAMTKVTNRGMFFYEAPARVKKAQGSNNEWIDALTVNGFSERLRKRQERFPPGPCSEKLEQNFRDIYSPIIKDSTLLDRIVSALMRAVDTAPEDASHAGAWMMINTLVECQRQHNKSAEINRCLDFIHALANVDKKILKKPTVECAKYWCKQIFPWLDADNDGMPIFLVHKYLLWAALTQFIKCALAGQSLSLIKEDMLCSNNLLLNSLPVIENGELILSSEMAIRCLKVELQKEGSKGTQNDLAIAMECSKKTVKRIQLGKSLLRPRYVYSLLRELDGSGLDDFPTSATTFINLWTKAQGEFVGDADTVVEYFNHYETVVEHVFTLFDEFVISGKIRVPKNMLN